MSDLLIVFPAREKSLLSNRLYKLSELLAKKNPNKQYYGLLGGEFGYGQEFENTVFKMHPYCWCDKEECPWCYQGAPNFEFKETNFTLVWYKYIGRSMEYDPISEDEINRIFDLCEKSLG